MKTISTLTPDEFKTLLDEYYAKPVNRHNMTSLEIEALSVRINHKFNIPIIKETGELRIIHKIVLRVDNFLYDNLPNEFYDLARDLNKGISDKEAKKLIRRLSKLANRNIDIPWIPERIELVIFKFIISIIVNAARKKCHILEEIDEEDNYTFAENDTI